MCDSFCFSFRPDVEPFDSARGGAENSDEGIVAVAGAGDGAGTLKKGREGRGFIKEGR
jgi:hypothetical protein